jgi:hypothetical protein
MDTIGDVISFHQGIRTRMELFGSTNEFAVTFLERFQAVGEALCEE